MNEPHAITPVQAIIEASEFKSRERYFRDRAHYWYRQRYHALAREKARVCARLANANRAEYRKLMAYIPLVVVA